MELGTQCDMQELPVVLKTKQKFYLQIPFTKII